MEEARRFIFKVLDLWITIDWYDVLAAMTPTNYSYQFWRNNKRLKSAKENKQGTFRFFGSLTLKSARQEWQ